MKVVTKQVANEVRFQDILDGQVFMYEDEAYMKLDQFYRTHDENGYEAETWNSVHLGSGELCEFHCYDLVLRPVRVSGIEIEY